MYLKFLKIFNYLPIILFFIIIVIIYFFFEILIKFHIIMYYIILFYITNFSYFLANYKVFNDKYSKLPVIIFLMIILFWNIIFYSGVIDFNTHNTLYTYILSLFV